MRCSKPGRDRSLSLGRWAASCGYRIFQYQSNNYQLSKLLKVWQAVAMHTNAQIIRSTMLLALCLSLSGCMTIGVAQLGHGVRETNNKGEVQKDDKGEVVWVEKPRPVY